MPATQEVIVVNPVATTVVAISGTSIGPQGPIGATGPQGVIGPQGEMANGFSYTYSNSTSMANPGTGKFRLNNLTLSSATSIAISTSNASSINVSGWLGKWTASSSSSKSTITILKKSDTTIFAMYQVTAVSMQSGYYVFSINPVSSNGTFDDLTDCYIAYVRTGDQGDIGVQISNTAPTNTAQLWADTSTSNAQVAVFDGGTPSAQLTSIKTRRGTASTWTSVNPVLDAGEFGYESDTTKFKIGTGSTAWNSLPYATAVVTSIPASGLTGTTMASNVVASSLTSFGTSPTLVTPIISGEVTGGTINGGSA